MREQRTVFWTISFQVVVRSSDSKLTMMQKVRQVQPNCSLNYNQCTCNWRHTESTDMKTNIRVRSIISRHFPLCIRVTDVLVHDGCIFASYSQWKTLLYYSEENEVLCHIWSKRSDIAFAHSTTYRQKIEVNLCMDVCILLQSILSKASCKYK